MFLVSIFNDLDFPSSIILFDVPISLEGALCLLVVLDVLELVGFDEEPLVLEESTRMIPLCLAAFRVLGKFSWWILVRSTESLTGFFPLLLVFA